MSKNIDIIKLDLATRPDLKRGKRVLSFVYFCIVIATFSVLLFRGTQLQIISSSEYYDSSLKLSTFKNYIPAQRGLFLDRNLNILAKNSNTYSLYLYKKDYSPEEFNRIKELIKNVTSVNTQENFISEISNSIYDLKLKDNLVFESLIDLTSDEDFDYYFYLVNQQKRQYNYPDPFSHIIGYMGKTESDDISKGYSQFDYIGKYKLEYQLEDQLRGVKGSTYNIDGIKSTIPAESGNNVQLTIDKDWQLALYKIIAKYSDLYNSAGGAGIIIDNTDGQIMSLVSYPGFDSNLYIRGITEDEFKGYANDRRLPLVDKAIGLQVAPGSTFKIITSYALLENGIVDEDTTFFSNRCLQEENFDFCEYHQNFYGQMDIVRALYKSSNLFFCTNSLKLDQLGKLNELFEAEKIFGLGQNTGINLIGELPGNIDTPEYKKQNFNIDWYAGDTCNAVIGQGSNTVTPVQMALVAQAIANKGVVYKPNLIAKITDQFGNVIEQPKSEILRTIPVKDKTIDLINQGMYDVANYWDGTVYPFLAGLPGNLRVKTGTAEASEILEDGTINNTTHGWIVGSFDSKGKTYSFAQVLNLGGGGFYVGQIMRDFINCLYSDFPQDCK